MFFLLFFSFISTAMGAQDNLRDEALKRALSQEMRQGHRALGYKQARIELLGRISLGERSGEYFIHDVYCLKEYGRDDFSRGRSPAPGRIPDEKVLNTEHTWPQSKFGGNSREMQKSDLHHLFPSDSEMNSIRGNFPFGDVAQTVRPLPCSTSRSGVNDDGQQVFEPPTQHRGNVARALFYFSVRYGLPIDHSQETALKRWNREDAVDEEERLRNEEISRLQGNRNPFIDDSSLSDRISDF